MSADGFTKSETVLLYSSLTPGPSSIKPPLRHPSTQLPGKGGKNVVDIRNGSGAKVTISEHIQGAQERIITITGTLDCVAKAFALVSQKILEELLESEKGTTGLGSSDEIKSRHLSVRLLVPNARMGM